MQTAQVKRMIPTYIHVYTTFAMCMRNFVDPGVSFHRPFWLGLRKSTRCQIPG